MTLITVSTIAINASDGSISDNYKREVEINPAAVSEMKKCLDIVNSQVYYSVDMINGKHHFICPGYELEAVCRADQ